MSPVDPEGLRVAAIAAAATAGAGLVTAAVGVFHPRAMLFGPGVWRGPTQGSSVALTFDDGPHPLYTARIAEILASHGARATFFCIGRELDRFAPLARALHLAGHELANHSYRHGTGADLFVSSRLVADLARCQETLFQITGSRVRYYRPAVGIRNPVVHHAARRLGLTIVTWTHSARDGVFALTAKRAQRLASQVQPGSIVALHDGASRERSGLREQTVQNLPLLLQQLSARGLRLRTLSELLGGGASSGKLQ
jgi:peptidoglycan/xylan/chitin deacetylase (PgdA/CDA1 family)